VIYLILNKYIEEKLIFFLKVKLHEKNLLSREMIKIFVITKLGRVEHRLPPRISRMMQQCNCDTD